MDDSFSVQDVPQNVMDMVRIFLASSNRGEQSVLILETKDHQIITKYRSVDQVAGASATTPPPRTTRRRGNPARARRSKLRLEEYQKKKESEKEQKVGSNVADGKSSSKASQLILEFGIKKDKFEDTQLQSPIPQLDGHTSNPLLDELSFTFKSDYGEEDILASLDEIFPPFPFVTSLNSRVRLGRLEADHQCIVGIRIPGAEKENFVWPQMPSCEEVFRDVKKIV